MALEGASPVMEPEGTTNTGPSGPPFRTLSSGPAGLVWEQPPPQLLSQACPTSSPLVLAAFSRPPLMAGHAGHSTQGTGLCSVIVQVRAEGGSGEPAQVHTVLPKEVPLSESGPGKAESPAGSVAETTVPTPANRGPLICNGSWAPGHPPTAPAAQLASIKLLVKAVPGSHGPCKEGSPTVCQHTGSPEDSCHPKSVYENFRRWQRFKSLASNYLPQSPDTEALSCFLIPVLRSLARLKPTMTLEEGLRRALQEWQAKSNFERMIFYDMAGKFMEFEAEEEMQIQKLQWLKGVQALSPQTPPKLDTQGSTGQQEGQQPVGGIQGNSGSHLPHAHPSECVLKKTDIKARAARPKPHRPQCLPKTKTPKEIPSEAVQEYVDIMEGLLGHPLPASGEARGEQAEAKQEQQEQDWLCADMAVLDYVAMLCSQEDFLTKVEAVVHPCFLAELLSSEPELDLLALAEELQQEEALSPAQLVDKRLLALKEKGSVQPAVSTDLPHRESTRSCPEAAHDAMRGVQGPQAGDSSPTSVLDTEPEDPEWHRQAHAQAQLLPVLQDSALAPETLTPEPQAPSPPRAEQHPMSLQGCRGTLQRLGSCFLGAASPAGLLQGPTDGSSEDEEELPSLAFLLASHHSLLPWGLALSPPQQKRCFSVAPVAAKARKHPLCGCPDSEEEAALSERPALALGLLGPSVPQKKRCTSLVLGVRQQCSGQ